MSKSSTKYAIASVCASLAVSFIGVSTAEAHAIGTYQGNPYPSPVNAGCWATPDTSVTLNDQGQGIDFTPGGLAENVCSGEDLSFQIPLLNDWAGSGFALLNMVDNVSCTLWTVNQNGTGGSCGNCTQTVNEGTGNPPLTNSVPGNGYAYVICTMESSSQIQDINWCFGSDNTCSSSI